MKNTIKLISFMLLLAIVPYICQAAFITEEDGTPSYSNYRTLRFPNGTISNPTGYTIDIDMSDANSAGFSYDDTNSVIQTYKSLYLYGPVHIISGTASGITLSGITFSSIDPNSISSTSTPASASATGTKGSIVWDPNYIYICTDPNTWKRSAITSW